MSFCSNCGKQNPSANKFCINCGAVLPHSTEQEVKKRIGSYKWIIMGIIIGICITAVYFQFFNNSKKTIDKAVQSNAIISNKEAENSSNNQTVSNNKPKIKLTSYYTGTIGNLPVTLELTETGTFDCDRGGSTFIGDYYYNKMGDANKLIVKGYDCGANIYLIEYNKDDTETGSFTGLMNGNTIEGSWSGQNKTFRFSLIAKE
jgi:hypothetical protein